MMKFRICVAFLLLTVLAGVSIAASTPVNDGTITDQVRIRLAGDQVVKGGGIDVDVKDGVVTLSGQVELEEQRDRAPKLARKVKGVKQVINNITIRSKTPAK